MFQNAIEQMLAFTRPLHTIMRSYGGMVMPGSATLFFVNDQGVAITCKHVAQLIPHADNINRRYAQFVNEQQSLPKDQRYKKSLQGLELKYHYRKETTIQQKNNFINCFDKIEAITVHTQAELDLAILVFKGFNEIRYSSFARFIPDNHPVKPGKSLCRLGFPFPEFSNYRFNEQSNNIEWTNTGNLNSPAFPLDGIVTRLVAKAPDQLPTGIEMSTPGLRGQSGGPLFDASGMVYGMQFATRHLHLGFDITDREIVSEGQMKKVSNYPFLHVGLCVHADRIKEFLRQYGIRYSTHLG